MSGSQPADDGAGKRNSVLWKDRFWRSLERAARAVEDDPHVLYEKSPDWEGGLNSTAINRLVASAKVGPGRVFEMLEFRDGGVVERRVLRVHHPTIPEPTDVETWHRYSPKPIPPSALARVLSYLRDWQSARATQLLAVQAPAAKPTVKPEPEVHRKSASAIEVDPGTFSVRVAGRSVRLRPGKQFDLFQRLARRPGSLVKYQELLDDVWGGRVVSRTTIQTTVGVLRAALATGRFRNLIRIEGVRSGGGYILDLIHSSENRAKTKRR